MGCHSGTIDTPMLRSVVGLDASGSIEDLTTRSQANRQALGRVGTTDEIANLVEFLLSDKSSYLTGTIQIIDGGSVC
jgi:NAD(P)-dependent dehydrogenase (short-subunit alcohol dehydrogenase family)